MALKPLRVLILSNSLNIGGAQRFAGYLLKGLDRRRIQPHLGLLQHDIGYGLPPDVPFQVLGYSGAGDLPNAIWKLRRLIRQTGAQVVLGVGTAVNVIIGLTLLFQRQRPAWIARVDTNPARRDLRVRTCLLRWLYPLADVIVANSAGLQAALKARYPAQAHKVAHLFNPVDFEAMDALVRESPAWGRRDGAPLLVTVGRAYGVKRWDLLLEAVARVRESLPVRLICCGGGPLLNRLKDRARQLGLQNIVHFPGHCLNPFPILAQADLFVLGSEAEGLPYALIEAQGLGLCAVSTGCDFGPDEIIAHGKTGLLVDVGNVAQMARAIRTLAGDAPLRMRMGRMAREQARERFDFRNRCRQWEDLIVQLGSAR